MDNSNARHEAGIAIYALMQVGHIVELLGKKLEFGRLGLVPLELVHLLRLLICEAKNLGQVHIYNLQPSKPRHLSPLHLKNTSILPQILVFFKCRGDNFACAPNAVLVFITSAFKKY